MRLLLPLLLLLVSPFAHAHPEWKQAGCTGVVDERLRFEFTVKFDVPSFLVGKPPKDATIEELDALMFTQGRLPSAHGSAEGRFTRGVSVLADGKPMAVRLVSFPSVDEIKAQSAKQGEADRYPVLLNAKLTADLPAGTHRVSVKFPEELGTVFANLRKGMEFQVVMAVAAGQTGDFDIAETPDQGAPAPRGGFLGYAVELLGDGFSHVLPEGWDHCLFMMAMFLGAASLRQALGRSLIFTVGHSITLSLVALGLVGSVGPWIEPFIALTIGVGALLAYTGKAGRGTMLAVPALFGLVHGLGFAAAVSDKLGDWDRASLIRLLIGFNLGVETAQVLVILATAALVWSLARARLPEARVRRLLCLGIAATGFLVMGYRVFVLVTGA